jgi:hypothetical protein
VEDGVFVDAPIMQKAIKTHLKTSQKSKIKNHIHPDILCLYTKFHKNVVYVNRKNCLVNSLIAAKKNYLVYTCR